MTTKEFILEEIAFSSGAYNSQREIAGVLGVHESTVSRAVSSLRRDGLIRRDSLVVTSRGRDVANREYVRRTY